jgi:hypothetical protein
MLLDVDLCPVYHSGQWFPSDDYARDHVRRAGRTTVTCPQWCAGSAFSFNAMLILRLSSSKVFANSRNLRRHQKNYHPSESEAGTIPMSPDNVSYNDTPPNGILPSRPTLTPCSHDSRIKKQSGQANCLTKINISLATRARARPQIISQLPHCQSTCAPRGGGC